MVAASAVYVQRGQWPVIFIIEQDYFPGVKWG